MTTYYVKPETGGGSPSGSGTAGDPWNGLASIPVQPFASGGGDELLLMDGTFFAENYQVDQTFTGAGFILRAQNRRAAILDGNFALGSAIFTGGKAGVHVSGLVVHSYTNVGIPLRTSAQRAASNCSVTDCEVYDCNAGGISIGSVPTTVDASSPTEGPLVNSQISENHVHDVGGHGVNAHGSGVTASYNLVERASNGTTNNWGVYAGTDSVAVVGGWSGGAGVNSQALSAIPPGFGAKTVVGVIAPGRTPSPGLPYVLADAGATTTPALNEFGLVAGVVYVNIGEDANGRTMVLVFANTDGPILESNTVTETQNNGGLTDGTGIGSDHGVTNAVIRSNVARNNTGDGIQSSTCESTKIYNNFSQGNGRYGINLATSSGANSWVLNNATKDNVEAGARVIRLPVGAAALVKDNVFLEPVAVVESDVDGVLTNEYNQGPGTSGPGSAPAPEIDANGYTVSSSSAYDAGDSVTGFHDTELDQNGFTFKNPPDIGLQSNLIAPETAAILADREPLDLNQSQTLGLPQLTSVNIVAPDDLLQAQTLDQTSIVETGTLGVEELTQAQALETPAIVKDIVVLDASQGQALGETLVFPSDTVTVPIDLFQGQALGLAQVAQFGTMSIEPLAQAQTLDEPVLTQASTVSADALLQAQSIGQPEVFSDTDLGVIESLTQAQSLAESSIQEIANFAPVDLSQGQSLGDVIITQVNFLAAEDISQAQMLGRPVVSDTTLPRLTPPSRRIKVARMDKLVIGA